MERKTDLYRAVNGESYIPCHGNEVLFDCGERLYARPYSEEFDTGVPSAEGEWADCSTKDFSCVLNDEYVMAVPTASLRKGMTYSLHGASLRIEECFAGLFSAEACKVALVTSRCVGDCGCLDEMETNRAVWFYYAPRYGITSIALASAGDELESALPFQSWMLIAEEGFLKAPLALEKAPLDFHPCARG